MSAILELPEVRARVGLLSVAAYELLAEAGAVKRNAELIRGVIVEKMPKSPLHSKLVERIFLWLLACTRAGLVVFSERPLRLAGSMPEPDAMVVSGQRSDFDDQHPTEAIFAVEVAVSSMVLDREKASLYAEANVSEYWIVLASEQRVEVYRQPEMGVYRQKRIYSITETLSCETVPGFQMPLADLFA